MRTLMRSQIVIVFLNIGYCMRFNTSECLLSEHCKYPKLLGFGLFFPSSGILKTRN
jgi:hypothetical protein